MYCASAMHPLNTRSLSHCSWRGKFEAAAARASSEHSETTWSARTWKTFVAQRISVAVQLSLAQEVAEALGLSVAADPRAR